MIDRYSYRVVWSPTYQKHAARCLEIPTLTSSGTTEQVALGQASRLASDFVDAQQHDAQHRVSDQDRESTIRTTTSRESRHAQRVVTRWHTLLIGSRADEGRQWRHPAKFTQPCAYLCCPLGQQLLRSHEPAESANFPG